MAEDYEEVCKRIGIPCEAIPRLKTRVRPKKKYYSEYYSEKAKQRVAAYFKQEIAHFDYRFETQQD